MQYATSFTPLNDQEWQMLSELIAPSNKTRTQGRPRVPQRPTFNAVLHAITIGAKLASVTSPDMQYPSPPTLRRFYELLIDECLFAELSRLLEKTRPELPEQIRTYTKGAAIRAKAANNNPTTWGFNLSPLPWGRPGSASQA